MSRKSTSEDAPKKKSAIQSFLNRTFVRPSQTAQANGKPPVPIAKSPSRSSLSATLARLAPSKREKKPSTASIGGGGGETPENARGSSSEHAPGSMERKCTTLPPGMTPPRSALSESDLRNVTIRRDYSNVAITPLAGATSFMSEDNLASPECGGAPYRTPSYLRISCAANGYRTPPRLAPHQVDADGSSSIPTLAPADSSTPIRGAAQMMPSLVERRHMAFRTAAAVDSPRTPSYSSPPLPSFGGGRDRAATTGAETPIGVMGNSISTPGAIKTLISQFDRLHLCSTDDETKENIKPHSLIVNAQPLGEEEIKTKTLPKAASDDEVNHNNIIKPSHLLDPYEERVPVEKKSSKVDVAEAKENGHSTVLSNDSDARDGLFFEKLLMTTRGDLNNQIQISTAQLAALPSTAPEAAAAALRLCIGKATLISGKKLGKFDQLIKHHMDPSSAPAGAPLPTLADLEGYWALVEIELSDVQQAAKDVDEWKKRQWMAEEENTAHLNGNAKLVRGEGEGTSSSLSSSASTTPSPSGRSTSKAAPGGKARTTKLPSAAPANAAVAEKRKMDAEKRRQQLAEIKARAKERMAKTTVRQESESGASDLQNENGSGNMMML